MRSIRRLSPRGTGSRARPGPRVACLALLAGLLPGAATAQLVLPADGQPAFPGSGWRPGATAFGLAADMNDDGWPDIVTGSLRVTVGLNNGHGVFTLGGKTADGPAMTGLAVGDLDGDGHQDCVASTTLSTNLVLSWLGDGTGALVPAGSATAFDSSGVALADFNLDGRLDAAVSHSKSGPSAWVLLGNGDGSFAPATGYGTLGFQDDLDVGDWDLDGDPDLLVGGDGSVGVRLLLWDGTGLVPGPSSSTLGGTSVALADVDGDGDPDVLNSYMSASTKALIHRRNDAGSLGSPSTYTVPLAGPIAVERAPPDGYPDVAIGAATSLTVFGNSAGALVKQPGVLVAQSVGDLAIADFNGDDRADVLAASLSANTATVFFRTLAGTLAVSPHAALPAGTKYCTTIGLADFNGDGRLDLVTGDRDAAVVSIALGTTGSGFGPWSTQPTQYSPKHLALADADVDGDLDVLLLCRSGTFGLPDGLVVHSGDGAGTLGSAVPTNLSRDPIDFAPGDLDGDGVPDAAVLADFGTDSSSLQGWLGTGASTFTPGGEVETGVDGASVALGDLDGDGDLDAAVTLAAASGSSVDALLILAGDGLGGFGAPMAVPEVPDLSGEVQVGDLDADGRPDLVVAGRGGGSVFLLRNDGAGGFQTPLPGGMDGADAQGLLVADVDDDGALDVLHNTFFEGGVMVVRGDGHGGFHAATLHPGSRGPGTDSIAVGDIDHDGLTDIVQLGTTDDDLSLLLRKDTPQNAWASIGGGLDGVAGQPRLSGTGQPEVGQSIGILADHAAPNAPAVIVFGGELLDAPLKGGRLVPTPDVIIDPLVTGAAGTLALSGTWAPGIPSGTVIWLQAWFVDGAAAGGVSATGGMSLTVP